MLIEIMILDGRKTREALLPGLIKKIKGLSRPPMLAIIQVGDRPDSTAFIKAKKSFAKKIGVAEKYIQVPEDIVEEKLLHIIRECNDNPDVTGIIVQLPLPAGIDQKIVIDAIDPGKDADGLTESNTQKLIKNEKSAVVPATARGILELLHYYKIKLSGKKVVVIGRSDLVGKPIALVCKNADATVTICHSQTKDLAEETRKADIIISAVGKPGLIHPKHVEEGQVVIDVGISRRKEGELVGDVEFEAVKDIVSAITPVPGGVGPMTVFALFENVVDLAGT